MVDEEQYCIDILTQISAVTKALEGVALALLDDHLRQVATTAADDTGDIDIDTCVLVVLPLDWDGP